MSWRRILVGVLAALTALVATVQLGAHAVIFARRLVWPLDLEWMEGGVLTQALRLMEGQSIYPAPSVEFIPFLYTPLYPALLAVVGKVVGLGYGLGRALSLLALLATMILIVGAAAREGRAASRLGRAVAWAVGLGGAGAVVVAFRWTGGFYDIVRADALLLALEVGAVMVAATRTTVRSAAVAGLLIALAFFAKQTAAPVGIALGLGLLIASPRRGIAYGLSAAGVLAVGIGGLAAATGGWFWRYIFNLHQGHDVRWDAILQRTPELLLRHQSPLLVALLVVVVTAALARRLGRADLPVVLTGFAGIVTGAIGYGTQWAFENAFIPSVILPALTVATLAARLAVAATDDVAMAPASAATALRPATVVATAVVILALGAQSAWSGLPDRERLSPGPRDREVAARFLSVMTDLARDGAQAGGTFVPFHPYYPVLVGGRPSMHRMGLLDVTRAGLGRPPGLDEGIASGRWRFVVVDWKMQDWELPGLGRRYQRVRELRDGFDAPRSYSGAETGPRWIYQRRDEPR